MASHHRGQALNTISCYNPTKASESSCPCTENMHTCTFLQVQWQPLRGLGKTNLGHTLFITMTLFTVSLHSYT